MSVVQRLLPLACNAGKAAMGWLGRHARNPVKHYFHSSIESQYNAATKLEKLE